MAQLLNSSYHRHRISKDYKKVFSATATELTVWFSSDKEDGLPPEEPTDETARMVKLRKIEELASFLKESKASQHFFVVSQSSTWSDLNISWNNFRFIVDSIGIGDDIFDLAEAFESRNYDTQQLRWSSSIIRYPEAAGQNADYEMGYRIQYPVANHRSKVEPFSIRQTGIWQKSPGPGRSDSWIILRPTEYMQQHLSQALGSLAWREASKRDPMLFHLVFLSFLKLGWDEYVEYLRLQLEQKDQAACFSRVGRRSQFPDSDYQVTFKDCQELQMFQWKMLRLSCAIEANLDALKTCKANWQCQRFTGSRKAGLIEVGSLIRQMSFHKRNFLQLATQARSTADLLYRIIEYRHNEQMDKKHDGLRDIVGRCYEILGTVRQQNTELTDLGRHQERDSQFLKALASISTGYLPAGLVAAIFSSNLIQLLPNSHLAVASQMWMPILSIVCLMGATFAATRVLERRFKAEDSRSKV